MTSVLRGQPISSLGGAAAFAIHPSGWVPALSDPHPTGTRMRGRRAGVEVGAGLWIQPDPGYSCLKDLSVCAFKCHLPLGAGDFPRLGCHFTCLTGVFVRRSRRPHTQPHCIFLVSRLSWKKNKKTQPGFLILTAQPSQCLLKPQGQACW